MEDLDEIFDNLEEEERKTTLRYFNRLYPNYDEMDYEARWYAEWDKLFIATHLREINLRYRRLRVATPSDPKDKSLKMAFNCVLTDFYSDLLDDDQWIFISDNLTDINKMFVDRKFYCMYNGIEFAQTDEMRTIVEQVKLENRQKSIGANNNS